MLPSWPRLQFICAHHSHRQLGSLTFPLQPFELLKAQVALVEGLNLWQQLASLVREVSLLQPELAQLVLGQVVLPLRLRLELVELLLLESTLKLSWP